MAVVYTNNASTSLSSGIDSSTTSITVGSVADFPTLTGSDYYYATIANTTNTKIEIVKVTAASGTTLTVVRGQDDTSATNFDSGDNFQIRVTSATLDSATKSDVDIGGGEIDGTPIGANSASTGAFTTVSATGNITVGGTVDGRDVATDGTKLDTIETNADVTDATNVDAAGAVMNSDTTTASMSFVVDEDTMTSDSATKVPTQQSVKAYVDSQVQSKDALSELSGTSDDITEGSTNLFFTSAEQTKLSGIETGADVTDTANVTSAGALMDSEVTNLSQVKAFSSSDYATAAQGTTADAALPKSGGTMTGNLLFGDSVIAQFGASQDIQIYHDGANSYIADTGTGNLTLRGTNLDINNAANNKAFIHCVDGGKVNLYYNGVEKLETTTGGISVTGDIYGSTGYVGYSSTNYYYAGANNLWHAAVVAGNERMRLEADGDLHADGDVIAYSTTISDERLKENIQPINDALSKVKQLKGCTFTYTADGKESAGLIAQDVEKVLPSAVSEKELPLKQDDGKEYKVLQYDQTIGLLVEAIKELSAKVEELENK